MRQIDVHLKLRDRDAVVRTIKAFAPVDWIAFPVEQHDRILIRVIAHDGRSQALTDTLQDALRDRRDWRITMIPLEATLPVPEPLEDEDARANLQVLREELLDDVSRDAALTRDFLILSALSTIVAAIGLNSDGVAAVIGAMVIAPLLGPILGFSLGAGLGNYPLIQESTRTLAAGIGVALAVAFLLSFFLPLNTDSHELMSRTEVRLDGVALALAAGGAAALSMAQGKAAVLVGVMVAAALLPPGAALGLFLGAQEWGFALRAGLLLTLNIACLILSALIVFRLKNIRPRGWIDQRNATRATWLNAALSAGFLIIVTILIIVLDLEQAVEFG
ncbi:TIGR00341 family protein [Henriciella aquimarina]|uniref:TIGR00341 family protein n=1 Tax=Henriciella aquimarina TaxID=545261 RepID=UPI000A003F97|nr:TIGR00341 family protein [Henriciella aquimarina]